MSYRATEWPYLVASDPARALRVVREAIRVHGRQADAAKALGVSTRTLARVLAKLKGGE